MNVKTVPDYTNCRREHTDFRLWGRCVTREEGGKRGERPICKELSERESETVQVVRRAFAASGDTADGAQRFAYGTVFRRNTRTNRASATKTVRHQYGEERARGATPYFAERRSRD